MEGTNTLEVIKPIDKFDGTDYVKWSRSFNDILQISWYFLSKIDSGLEKPESILRSRNKDPNQGSYNEAVDERESSNVDGIKAWDSASEHLCSV